MDPLEPYYLIVSHIYGVIITSFNALCYVLWIRDFMQGKAVCLHQNDTSFFFRIRGLLSGRAVWVGAVYAMVMVSLQMLPFYFSSVFAHGIGGLLAFATMCLMDRQNYEQKIFLAVTFFCMRWQSWEVQFEITNWLYRSFVSFLESTRDHASLSFIYTYVTESYEFWFYVYIVDCIVSAAVGMALLYGAVRLMMRVCCDGEVSLKGKETLLLIAPSVSGMIAYGVLNFYRDAYESETVKSVFDLKGHFPLMVLYGLVCYVTILVSVHVFGKWKREQKADEQRRLFEAQMKDMQSHIAEVEGLYSDMRRLRHDLSGHLMTLEQLYRDGEYGEAGRYAETLKAEVQRGSPEIKTGNPVTDAILSGRKREMEEAGISFACEFHYPRREKTGVFDISIILNNALSNAIEAVGQERRREVILSSKRVKNMYMIEVANTFTGELKMDHQSGLPLTTKAEEGHGFGLAGIRHVAQKYYGDIEITVEEREGGRYYVLRVMLQMET